MTSSFRRALVAAIAVTAALAASAPAAFGATLSYSGTTLTYTGGAADNDVAFDQPAPRTVEVTLGGSDTDVITSFPAGTCTEDTPGTAYTCFPVDTVVANSDGGDDQLDAQDLDDIETTLDGGTGDDFVSGGDAVDTVGGGDGADLVAGDGNNDTLNGGNGGDRLLGDAGDDTENGGEGDDSFFLGDTGNDTHNGGAGDDKAFGDEGNDTFNGGSGYDEALTGINDPPQDAVVTLDDQPNDRLNGDPGEADNIRSDVEAVRAEPDLLIIITPASGNDSFTGNAAANTLTGGQGNDTLDGQNGNDSLLGGDGDDTIKARDGFFDFVNCGSGNDTAEVDTLDQVEECENVQRADAGNALDVPEDRPPTVTLTGPAPGALLRTNAPTVLTAEAADDKGIAAVLFLDDDRIVCADTAAPYTCAYQPRGEDVGRNTLVAIAVDTAQQTASTTRAFNVSRFAVTGITGAVTPSSDRRAPFVFRTAGRLRLPTFVTPALGCADGQVSIQVKAGAKTISTRRADLRRDCSFSSTVRFANRSRFTRNGRLRFTLRFTGNEVLDRSAAIARNIRTR